MYELWITDREGNVCRYDTFHVEREAKRVRDTVFPISALRGRAEIRYVEGRG